MNNIIESYHVYNTIASIKAETFKTDLDGNIGEVWESVSVSINAALNLSQDIEDSENHAYKLIECNLCKNVSKHNSDSDLTKYVNDIISRFSERPIQLNNSTNISMRAIMYDLNGEGDLYRIAVRQYDNTNGKYNVMAINRNDANDLIVNHTRFKENYINGNVVFVPIYTEYLDKEIISYSKKHILSINNFEDA